MLLLSGDSVIRRIPCPYLAILAVLVAGSVAGCDREKRSDGQAAAPQAKILPDETKAASSLEGFEYRLDRSHNGKAAPTSAFTGPDHEEVRLADFRGKPLLVNLWATWCAPCIAEMPTLDKLAAHSGTKMAVIAVAQDLQGAEVVDPWFAQAGMTTLKPYLDPQNGLLDAANSALPTSIYYDAQGREIWRIVGAINWQGDDARTLLAEAGQ